MSKILFLAGVLLMNGAWSQSALEEAIILNQEMKFLEESAKNPTVASSAQGENQKTTIDSIKSDSLENKYFGKEQDAVSSKLAAPQKRRYLAP